MKTRLARRCSRGTSCINLLCLIGACCCSYFSSQVILRATTGQTFHFGNADRRGITYFMSLLDLGRATSIEWFASHSYDSSVSPDSHANLREHRAVQPPRVLVGDLVQTPVVVRVLKALGCVSLHCGGCISFHARYLLYTRNYLANSVYSCTVTWS